MFELTRLLESRVKGLSMLPRDVTAARLEHVPTRLRQDDGDVAMTVHLRGSDESLVAEVSQIA
jgi:hypothetical protein